jgi:hypothetical protein
MNVTREWDDLQEAQSAPIPVVVILSAILSLLDRDNSPRYHEQTAIKPVGEHVIRWDVHAACHKPRYPVYPSSARIDDRQDRTVAPASPSHNGVLPREVRAFLRRISKTAVKLSVWLAVGLATAAVFSRGGKGVGTLKSSKRGIARFLSFGAESCCPRATELSRVRAANNCFIACAKKLHHSLDLCADREDSPQAPLATLPASCNQGTPQNIRATFRHLANGRIPQCS